ncbi:uncharacterized protein LOC122723284 [Manihot esculenta]|uniref:uncharacterized protein LOC122723284 n=1 Tax=Manihot esculenta TaxID=3983 RepID=UPI001CC4D975|nr:uncharacterized protein LOC122723284 [Manihot esculenta]
MFKSRFITCIPPKKLSSDLQKIRQGEGESLRSYISRFNAEAIQVEELNHEIAYKTLKKETRDIKFMDSLIKNHATTYYQLMDKAQKYIRLDDEVQTLKEDKRTSQNKTQKLDKQSYKSEMSYPISRSKNNQGIGTAMGVPLKED